MTGLRTDHFTAFDTALKSAIPALASLTFDGDVPLNADGTVMKKTYLVEHDMGFDEQSDDRLSAFVDDVADGTYRVIVRVVALTRAAVRATADAVKSGMVGRRLTIAGRNCGLIQKDPGSDAIERDTTVSPPLFYLDIDFVWRSQRA